MSSLTDGECLEAWQHARTAESLRALVERYASFIYSSAYRRMGSAEHAEEITRAVFLVMARRAHKLPKKTVLAGWLFKVTALACRKVIGKRCWSRCRNWFRRRKEVPPESTLWSRIAPELDAALEKLCARQRNAVLLPVFLRMDSETAARTLGTRRLRADKRAERGLKKLTARLRRRGIAVEPEALAQVCSAEGCAVPLPEGLVASVLESIQASGGKKPSCKLARRVLRTLAWARWRRRYFIANACLILLLGSVGALAWHIDGRTGHSHILSTFIVWSVRFHAWRVAEPARPWPANAATPRLDARLIHNAQELYCITNIWQAHFNFSRKQWQALEPKHFEPMPNFRKPDGLLFLRNPQARRNGLIGVFGYEFGWTHGDFEFGGASFTNAAVRLKGNLRSLFGIKRAFKVDLNRFAKGQKLHGLDELTFNNLVWDSSRVSEALGYEFFREAGVPAPRTAYAWLSVSVQGQWDRKPLGLYLMVEPVDRAFMAERFGSKNTPLFKPVTYDLFAHLGDAWSAYAGIYDLKTKAAPEQLRRVMDLARLVSCASDAEFAEQIGTFLDLDEFGRFLAVEVLLSNYDSPLTTGHNFYLYLDAQSNKFGFIPWDLDAAWGSWSWIGGMELASIWHPWVGKNRFLERVMGLEAFRQIYRGHLEDFLNRLLVPERLHRRIEEMASLVRGPTAAESNFRLNKFEQAVGWKPIKPASKFDFIHQAHDLNRFIEARAKAVRLQLDGKSPGIIIKAPAEK